MNQFLLFIKEVLKIFTVIMPNHHFVSFNRYSILIGVRCPIISREKVSPGGLYRWLYHDHVPMYGVNWFVPSPQLRPAEVVWLEQFESAEFAPF